MTGNARSVRLPPPGSVPLSTESLIVAKRVGDLAGADADPERQPAQVQVPVAPHLHMLEQVAPPFAARLPDDGARCACFCPTTASVTAGS